ncbi:MAG: hypothetical protein U9N84_12405 [Actinomycetota bacterium]|nr:hypothetical protein [Actinomycetota bacterium]
MGHSLQDIEEAIRASWGADTCYEPYLWDEGPPSRGQSGTSVMVLLDFLGGEILEAKVYRGDQLLEHHYWVRLPSGVEVDLTRDQYGDEFTIGEPVVRQRPRRLRSKAAEQYQALLDRVTAELERRGAG